MNHLAREMTNHIEAGFFGRRLGSCSIAAGAGTTFGRIILSSSSSSSSNSVVIVYVLFLLLYYLSSGELEMGWDGGHTHTHSACMHIFSTPFFAFPCWVFYCSGARTYAERFCGELLTCVWFFVFFFLLLSLVELLLFFVVVCHSIPWCGVVVSTISPPFLCAAVLCIRALVPSKTCARQNFFFGRTQKNRERKSARESASK